MAAPMKEEEIINICDLKGFIYLGIKYINKKKHYKYQCVCGEVDYVTMSSLKRRKGCIHCSGRKKKIIEEIRKYFKEHGCELLSTRYESNSQPLKYICSCGNISNVSWAHFKHGQRCKECWIKNHSGKNHYAYNEDLTDVQRKKNGIDRTKSPKYRQWKKNVLEKDIYICQKCGNDLNKFYNVAHHIDSWDLNSKLRYEVSNGISFCENCHKLFHSKYGYGNNNKEQLEEYLNGK